MIKSTIYFGIDVSKDFFDVNDSNNNYYQFSNCKSGFKSFLKVIKENAHVVMEVTGSYHQKLATFLYDQSVKVSVVNPLVIKRFIQMRLRTIKTDKADAQMIRFYGEKEDPKSWCPSSVTDVQAIELLGLIDLLIKQRTSLLNKLHSQNSKHSKPSMITRSISKSIRYLNKEIKRLEIEVEEIVKINRGNLLTCLCSIPGIGKKTAILLITLTNGFEDFENSKQLSSYFGLSPIIIQSGTSVRGRSRISKKGNPHIRNLLFMCSFTACQHNKACKELYQRITSKGKSKKLALIAVTNKLLKQSLAIAKSGIIYDENFRSVKPEII